MEISLAKILDIPDIPIILQHPDDPKKEDNLYIEIAKFLLGQSKYTFSSLYFCVLLRINGCVWKSNMPHYIERGDELKKHLIVSQEKILEKAKR